MPTKMPDFSADDEAASDHYQELKKDGKLLNQVQKGKNDNFDKIVKKGVKIEKSLI